VKDKIIIASQDTLICYSFSANMEVKCEREAEMKVEGIVTAISFDSVKSEVCGIIGTTSSSECTASIWTVNWTDLTVKKMKSSHVGRVNQVAFNRNGDILASCSEDGCIKVWSVSKSIELFHFQQRQQVKCLLDE
jgi:WD40 repeat protein